MIMGSSLHKINNANIKEWAKNYKGELFDGILCDPPYELGFMGKSWDSSGIAFDTEMWADIFKLLKPGAHLLAFSGSRTYHRMAVAIEDAGLEGFEDAERTDYGGFHSEKGLTENGRNPENRVPMKNGHPTVKPLSLTKYLATLIKPPTGGRLLVPFSGSGSEMIGALQAGWEYVEGVELTEEYIPIAEARIDYWLEKQDKEQISLL